MADPPPLCPSDLPPAATSALPVPSACIDHLPPELIAEILEYIPMRPRLLVAARVSRRWRSLVSSLPIELHHWRRGPSSDTLDHIFKTMQCVTGMRTYHVPLIPPATLRSLHVKFQVKPNEMNRDDFELDPYRKLTSLTKIHLELPEWYETSRAAWSVFLTNNASLTSLTLVALSSRIQPDLRDLHMPQLRYLRVQLPIGESVYYTPDPWIAFFDRHRHQLRTLKVQNLGSFVPASKFFCVPYPNLRKAFLEGAFPVGDELGNFVSACTALTSLRLNSTSDTLLSIPSSVVRVLCGITVGRRLPKSLEACKNVTKIFSHAVIISFPALPYLSQLTSLSCFIGTTASLSRALRSLPALRKLRIELFSREDNFVAPVYIPPGLTQVTVVDNGSADIVATARALLRAFIAGGGLSVIKVLRIRAKHDEEWEKLLDSAAKAGVEKFLTSPSFMPQGWLCRYPFMEIV